MQSWEGETVPDSLADETWRSVTEMVAGWRAAVEAWLRLVFPSVGVC